MLKVGMKNRKNSRNRRNRAHSNMKGYSFIDSPIGGAVMVKSGGKRSLHAFDSIGFAAQDINGNIIDVKGLCFQPEKGWYETDAVIPI